MMPHDVSKSSTPRVIYAPGDQVIRYVDGQPFFCTVIEVEPGEQVRVTCQLWPSGYSAIVNSREVALVAHGHDAMSL